jgi:hypothetical protein
MSTATASITAPSRDWTPIAAAALAVVFYVVVCAPIPQYSMRHDFLSFYTGASFARDGALDRMYSFDAQVARQERVVPGITNVAPFIRPPVFAAILAPLTTLPLAAAFAVWLAAQIGILAGLWFWCWKTVARDSLVFAALFLPSAYGIAHGQDCVFLASLLLASWILMERGRDGPAGAVAGLAFIKFHLLLLFVPALLIRKRWRMAVGVGSVAAAEAFISIALVGPAGVRQYIDLLHDPKITSLHPSPERMVNLRGLLVNLGADYGLIQYIAVVAVVGAALWLIAHAQREWVWFWGSLVASLLISPHAYEYDAALLLPGLLFSIFRDTDPKLRITAATAAIPVPYLFTLFGPPWAIAPSLAIATWFAMLVRRGVTQ